MLRALYENATPLFEAKLLVTGAGKVGKSWALAALRGEDPHVTVGEQTTYGVYCGELHLHHPGAGQGKVPADAEIHLNTWDFGGQDVYRITHQFFFTQEAIFLLVWNPRDGAEKCGVREWLRMIELRTGGNAKVIMVASHCPREKTPYLPNYYRDRLPPELSAMIVDEIAIDSELGDNIAQLRAIIARHAAGMRFMGDPFPVSWQAARAAVATLNPPNKPKKRAAYLLQALSIHLQEKWRFRRRADVHAGDRVHAQSRPRHLLRRPPSHDRRRPAARQHHGAR